MENIIEELRTLLLWSSFQSEDANPANAICIYILLSLDHVNTRRFAPPNLLKPYKDGINKHERPFGWPEMQDIILHLDIHLWTKWTAWRSQLELAAEAGQKSGIEQRDFITSWSLCNGIYPVSGRNDAEAKSQPFLGENFRGKSCWVRFQEANIVILHFWELV